MRFAVLAAAAAFGLASAAQAADVYNEITLSQLSSVLSEKFDVQTVDGSSGGQFLIVKGAKHTVGATLIGCGGTSKCEGVTFFAPLKAKYSSSQANKFNEGHTYAKIVVHSDGDTALRTELLTVGGVTSENIWVNCAILMARKGQADGGEIASNDAGKILPAAQVSALEPAQLLGEAKDALRASITPADTKALQDAFEVVRGR